MLACCQSLSCEVQTQILDTTSHWSYCVGKKCLKKFSQQPLQGKESSKLGTKVQAKLFAQFSKGLKEFVGVKDRIFS